MAFRVSFFGGAESVTGSNFFVEAIGEKGEPRARIVIDCGMEQGKDFCAACSYEPFPFPVEAVDALVITHAHLDHIGRAPKLIRDGFRGKVYMTPPTRDLTDLMLRDTVHIMRMEEREKGRPPLYEEADVDALMSRIETIEYGNEWEVAPGVSAVLRTTGHILGSASVRLRDTDGSTLAFTGDLGNSPSPLLPDMEPVQDADAVVMVSVYGNRLHDAKEDRVDLLAKELVSAVERGGDRTVVLIPAFSMERTQLMLYELSNLMEAGKVPKMRVFLDSPLAIKVTEVYEKHARRYFKQGVQAELAREGSLFRFPFLTMTESRQESLSIADTHGPKIIIAGAGMSHGGRIGTHEARYLPLPETTLLIVGYQAPGSPGRMLADGAKRVRINGREVKVRATVRQFSGWSAHADRDGLMTFAEGCLPRTKRFFVTLGEPASSRFLAQRIRGFLGVRANVPQEGEVWEVGTKGIKKYSA